MSSYYGARNYLKTLIQTKMREGEQEESPEKDANNNTSKFGETIAPKKGTEKYSLRQRKRKATSLRETSDLKPSSPEFETSKEKCKSKSAPLSKYRRKTANARERTRMREINVAFENLRRCVPLAFVSDEQCLINEKLTKITTLRLAMKYIRTLSEALANPENDVSHLLNWKQLNYCPDESSSNSSNNYSEGPEASAAVENASKSKCAGKCQGRIKDGQRMKKETDLSYSTTPVDFESDVGLLLESDGESQHLSEPCLSPVRQSSETFGESQPENSHLELKLLFETDNDSSAYSEPSCLSPLGTFESLNPFPDLFQYELATPHTFDLFLT